MCFDKRNKETVALALALPWLRDLCGEREVPHVDWAAQAAEKEDGTIESLTDEMGHG